MLLDNELLPLIVLPSRISDKTTTIIDHFKSDLSNILAKTNLIWHSQRQRRKQYTSTTKSTSSLANTVTNI